ncbi:MULTISPECIES: choice-of-anchor Q domain-containing protein [unclassified Microcoleus]|uniref:choice-of-anchor Q domain-containing protein n=1 Tax=unclassified Microcoleus TaxID=2642155 RepID=UPI002FCE76E0
MTTYTVTNTNDSGAGSLRDAITTANGTVGVADIIDITGVSSTIVLATGLSITDSVSINGPGASNLTVSGNNAVRVLDISGTVTVNIDSLTIANGSVASTKGGGIRVGTGSTLNLTNSTVSGNTVTVPSFAIGGGGIYSQGTVAISNSTISGNSADYGAGIAIGSGGLLTVTNSTISGNFNASTLGSQGGGVYNYKGTVNIANSTISGNSVRGDGSGLYNRLGTMTVTNSTISNNIISGSGANRGGGIFNNRGIFTLTNSTVSGNTTGNQGGGISSNGVGATLTVTNSTISGNTANGFGGAISTDRLVNISNSTISGNSASNGGGIHNSGGTITLTSSTVSGNSAKYGGGINNLTTATITNSTISGNSATQFGGGIYNGSSVGTANITNSTISNNTATNGGGIAQKNATAKITIGNSIVAGNTSPTGAEANITAGTFTSSGNNLVGQNNSAGGFTTIASDILLPGAISTAISALANNGGLTQTHALVGGSPAIDAGTNPNSLTTDQRGTGFNRVFSTATDIGAYELQQFSDLAISAANSSQAEANSGTTNFTFTVTRTGNTSISTIAKYVVTASGANPSNATDFGGTFPSGTVTFNIGDT